MRFDRGLERLRNRKRVRRWTRTLFTSTTSIISIRAGGLDNVSDFIFPAHSVACGENVQNGGLTRISVRPVSDGP
jgi:hypothetical protein